MTFCVLTQPLGGVWMVITQLSFPRLRSRMRLFGDVTIRLSSPVASKYFIRTWPMGQKWDTNQSATDIPP